MPVTGNTKHLLKRLDSASVKSEPKDENADRSVNLLNIVNIFIFTMLKMNILCFFSVEKTEVAKERRKLDFRCRYCPRRFTSTLGWDAHLVRCLLFDLLIIILL